MVSVGACRRNRDSGKGSTDRLLTQARRSMEQGDVGSAIQAYRRALSSTSGSSDTWNRLGLALEYRFYETGDDAFRDEALSAYRKAIERDKNCLACLINEANLLWTTGDRSRAAKIYSDVVRRAPDHLDAKDMRRRIRTARSEPSMKPPQKGDRT